MYIYTSRSVYTYAHTPLLTYVLYYSHMFFIVPHMYNMHVHVYIPEDTRRCVSMWLYMEDIFVNIYLYTNIYVWTCYI